MGMCVSCESTSVATAKVILEDGSLEEYSYPVKASYLLSNHPSSFICNSNDMDFDVVLSAVRDHDDLQLGHLYFILPRTLLSSPLQPHQMAALAVKANAALLKSAGAHKCHAPFFRLEEKAVKVADHVVATPSSTRSRNSNRNSASKLSAIRE